MFIKLRNIFVCLAIATILAMMVSLKRIVNLTESVQSYILRSDNNWLSYPTDYDQKGPKVIWLLSFPNSGNSFTTSLIRSYTGCITATNYGENHLNDKGFSEPIHSGNTYQNGPFIVGATSTEEAVIGKYVLTKTHCGGRCTRCAPANYIETKESFKEDCLGARRAIAPIEASRNMSLPYETVQYEENLVSKAIHIIRNPLDNVISRYHLFLKMKAKGHVQFDDDNESQVNSFTNDSGGFTNWCKVHDQMYPDEERKFFEGTEFYDLLQHIPCHADFYRYAQWHNHAFDIISEMSIPSIILHYEDFETNFDRTKKELLEFIEAEEKAKGSRRKTISFRSRENYSLYYTKTQQDNIWKFLKIVCNKNTYDHIHSRYNMETQ